MKKLNGAWHPEQTIKQRSKAIEDLEIPEDETNTPAQTGTPSTEDSTMKKRQQAFENGDPLPENFLIK